MSAPLCLRHLLLRLAVAKGPSGRRTSECTGSAPQTALRSRYLEGHAGSGVCSRGSEVPVERKGAGLHSCTALSQASDVADPPWAGAALVTSLNFLVVLVEEVPAYPMAYMPAMGRRLHQFMASSNTRSDPQVAKAASPPRSPEHAFGYLNPHYSDCMLRIFCLGESSLRTVSTFTQTRGKCVGRLPLLLGCQ